MLTKIREKSQGAFSWVLLLIIVIPFSLWGIENYISGASEKSVASVGHTDFFQEDLNKAYQQFSQQFAGMNIDEETLKKQALSKLIKDEVLLQYVTKQGLVSNDADTRKFIQNLDYFKVNNQFDKKQYDSLLAAQHISSGEFVKRIKKAQTMAQFQTAIVESHFATAYDIEHFFKIQNQQRDISYFTIPVTPAKITPTDAEIKAYYTQHQKQYQTQEKVAIEYVTLSLDNLAKEIKVTDAQLKSFYETQKAVYSVKEQRKISHILFEINSTVDAQTALKKATEAAEALKNTDFASLAAKVSDDKSTADKGGDLGFFEAGAIADKEFEKAASSLKLNEVSQPVKSKYGYHLIKVTELTAGKTKAFDEVKEELKKTYQRKEAENNFYALLDKLTEISYQNPDSLTAVAETLGVSIEKTAEFTRDAGEGVAAEKAVRNAAFSEEVLKGNNSEPVELGTDKVLVLRMSTHHPVMTRELNEVKPEIIAALLTEKARQQAVELAATLKKQLMGGKTLQAVADEQHLKVQTLSGLKRTDSKLPAQMTQAVFKAAKPIAGKPTVLTVALPSGEQAIVSLQKVTEGVMSESDKKQRALAEKNIANALGQTMFDAVLNSLQADADVSVSLPAKQP